MDLGGLYRRDTVAYDQALLCVTNESERRFLEKRLAELRKRPIST
jgi:hypothetical protein